VTASKAVIVDASKDIGDFRNLDCTNLDAGASGTAGTVDIFPATASKGKFILSCTNQDGDTTVTFKPAAMAQNTVISIPDPGSAGTANVMLTDQANDTKRITASASELNVLDGVTAGTVGGGDAVVVDSNKDIGDFRNLDAVNIDLGASGTAGTLDIFPTTASKGKLILACADQDGDTSVTVTALAMGQATGLDIPDPGTSSAYFLMTTAANDGDPVDATAAEINRVCDYSAKLVDINCASSSAIAVTAATHGSRILTTGGATHGSDCVITLWNPTGTGETVELWIDTTIASNNLVVRSGTGDFMGTILTKEDGGAIVPYVAGANDNKINLNGTTQGGAAGSKFKFTDIASGEWAVEGVNISSGSEATPFSAV
jgi:hypothetical protein